MSGAHDTIATGSDLAPLVERLRVYLIDREEQLRAFRACSSQLEGWLKGELLCFLLREQRAGRLTSFEREARVPAASGRRRIDLKLEFGSGSDARVAWMELKHWHIGWQKDYRYTPSFYFGDGSEVGVRPDVTKLAELRSGDRYLLLLLTANPGSDDWQAGVTKYNEKFAPPRVEALTRPADYPEFFYLGLLAVS